MLGDGIEGGRGVASKALHRLAQIAGPFKPLMPGSGFSGGGTEADPFAEDNGPTAQRHERQQGHDEFHGKGGARNEGPEAVFHVMTP